MAIEDRVTELEEIIRVKASFVSGQDTMDVEAILSDIKAFIADTRRFSLQVKEATKEIKQLAIEARQSLQ